MDSARQRSLPPSPAIVTALLCAAVVGCRSPRTRLAPDDLDAPIFGDSKPTTYVLAPENQTVHARDLATAARILRRYKTLDAAEKALVRSSVSRRLNGLIALEVRRLERLPQNRSARAAIRKIADPRVVAASTARLDAEIRSEAMRVLAQRVGRVIASPVRGSDNRSAVVFSRLEGESIVVQDAAYELDRPIASLTEGAGIDAGNGTAATYFPSPAVAVVAPVPPR